MRALIIAADKFEDSELFYPYYRLKEAGVQVDVATPKGNPIAGKHEIEIDADLKIENADEKNYYLMIIPGGRSPEQLRVEAPESIDLIKKFHDDGKIISAICHGPQLLMSADTLNDRKATCYWSLIVDLENAGATFLNEPVVVDDNLITSRHPPDLPDFMRETLKKIER